MHKIKTMSCIVAILLCDYYLIIDKRLHKINSSTHHNTAGNFGINLSQKLGRLNLDQG